MPRLPALVIISGGIFALMMLAIVAGDVLIASGAVRDPLQYQTPAKIVFFSLFVAFGFSLIPLMVRAVLAGLEAIGKSLDVRAFAPLIARPGWIVWPIWLLMAGGMAVALPAAIKDGFFGPDAGTGTTARDSAAEAIAKMPSQGTLVAAPGMTVASMLASSTLAVQRGSKSELFSGAQFGGAAIFDYRIAGTATVFRRCRYYYVTRSIRHPSRVGTLNVGISSEKLSRAQLAAADRELSRRFAADRWSVVRAHTWRRGRTILALHSRRLDDAAAGERPDAGEWIQYVELYEPQ
ncbi:MAG TPA: hypothetical protein VIX83_08735 [Candidatus Cybelea sp.]